MNAADEEIYRQLHDWLLNHIRTFDAPDEETRRHFELKRIHSLKVADEIAQLGRALGLEPRPLLIARAIGLLHDAGRFEQYRRYRTYNDAASTDHGALGAAIVASNGLLTAFDAAEVRIITQSILHHNKLALPQGVTDPLLFFLKLIRDADKLDIYRVIMGDLIAAEQALFKMLISKDEDASEEMYAVLIGGGNVNYQLAQNTTDRLLMHVGWVFEINYLPTLRAIAQRGYLDQIAATLPATPRTTQILLKARAHLAATLAEQWAAAPGTCQ